MEESKSCESIQCDLKISPEIQAMTLEELIFFNQELDQELLDNSETD
jgi:hypothetical protein